MKRGICWGSLPNLGSAAEKLELAKRAGYDGVELNTLDEPSEREEVAAAARRIGIELHSVMARAKFLGDRSDLVGIGRTGDDLRASLCKPERDRPADAAGAARDQRDHAADVQTFVHVKPQQFSNLRFEI